MAKDGTISRPDNIFSVVFFCCRLLVILLILFEGVSSSSGCLRKAVLVYCGTPGAIHIIIMN